MNSQTVYTALFMKRPFDGDSLIAMEGPSVHQTHQEALGAVMDFVAKEVFSELTEAYLELLMDMEFDAHEPGAPLTEGGLKVFFRGLPATEQQIFIDWYFAHARQSGEAFYQISEHTLPAIVPEATRTAA
jgi:hypothetical protein